MSMYKGRSLITTTISTAISIAAAFGFGRILPNSLRYQIEPAAHATTSYIVNTTDDHDDGVCNAADCTLREAINAANALVNSNTSPRNIDFSIPGSGVHTINVTSPLPQLTLIQIDINGPTLNGMPLIEINGANAGANANGLSFVNGAAGFSGSGVFNLIINRFGGYGVSVDGDGVSIRGCFVGTNTAGTAAAPNGAGGIRINSVGTRIESNVISGNKGDGIDIVFGDPIISANFIGTNATGTAAVANTGHGIKIENNLRPATIGGASTGVGNVISGNGQIGIQISGTSGPVLVQNNFIGTNSSATVAIPNRVGIDIENADGNKIIGNTIFRNSSDGVQLNSSSNTLQGNFIGYQGNGFPGIDNVGSAVTGANGVTIISGNNNTMGGTQINAGNVISGNSGSGVAVSGGSGTLILGNFITANVANETGNHFAGVSISGGSAIIGGTEPGSRNVISGNSPFSFEKKRPELFPDCCPPTFTGEGGVYISGGTGSQVIGNFIGTNSAGTDPLGSQSVGVTIDGAANNIIGGAKPGAGNIIAGNLDHGVRITGAGAANNVVEGNLIRDNSAYIYGYGVSVLDGASNNTIGGTEVGSGNTIDSNSGGGVIVGPGTGNAILGNSILSNSGLGIDLNAAIVGPIPNDNCDTDAGSNNLQNFPVITSAMANATTTTIQGTLNSTANTQFRIEFFANAICNSSGNGQGQTFLGFTNATTDASCNANFSFSVPNARLNGPIITATATDANNNTSEFSACATLVGIFPTLQLSAAAYTAGEGDKRVDVTISRSANPFGSASVNFATGDVAFAQNCSVTNGKASSRCDYEARTETVDFAPGETSKTISILLVDDSYLEGPETFTVKLINPVGAYMGAPSMATVTITDDDPANGPNPIDAPGFFVRMHYLDFLNRDADASGFDFWTNQILSCGNDQACIQLRRSNASAAFFLSTEFQQTGYFVERIYKAAFGDASGFSTFGGAHYTPVPVVRLSEFLPDTQQVGAGVIVGQPGWETALENNKRTFALDFVRRARFSTAFPYTMAPAQFVDRLNQNMGNVLSASEWAAAVALFGATNSASDVNIRAQALRQVAENQKFSHDEFNRAFVLTEYFGYLRRDPNDPVDSLDYKGYEFWLTKLNQFNGDFQKSEMVKAFINSAEYRQRFGP